MKKIKPLDIILGLLPKKYWNAFSNVLTFFTLPTIGSPMRFSFRGFSLVEYDLRTMDHDLREQFFTFCYPADEIDDPRAEIEIDKQYWPSTRTFVVYAKDSRIVGCIQFVQRQKDIRLPVEYSHVQTDSPDTINTFTPPANIARYKVSEIYRCRRAFDLTNSEAVTVVSMLFKTVWAQAIFSSTAYSFLTYDQENVNLFRLYTRKLLFKNTGVNVSFFQGDKLWRILYIDWREACVKLGNTSRAHFLMKYFFNAHLKKKRLRIEEPEEELVTPEETVLFANVVTAKATPWQRARVQRIHEKLSDPLSATTASSN